MTKVQVCGVRSLEDALMCEAAGVDAIGFVSVEGRKRNVPLERIKNIIGRLGPSVDSTLIGFPRTPQEFIEKGRSVGADVLQVYTLTAAEIGMLKESGFTVVRAVGIDSTTGRLELTVDQLKEMVAACDFVLFEPRTGGNIGGMGVKVDYVSILTPYIIHCRRFSIAGGLTPDNVQEALKLGPYAVDVSSGVESDNGRKDPDKVRRFVKRCHV
ncbi:MAG: phosphoribosylanthranilate isomerase [Methanopyri archaeon]|jgi:phosphoribosylanthranilate isomerase|nr:phosphoribosylanthranilate isomerase [Methanopyri archaeon]